MKNRRNSYYLYLNWPVYLAQWYAHEMYRLKHSEDEHIPPYIYDCSAPVTELDPVDTRRGSAERNILEMCLSKQPDNIRVLPSKEATICLVIPNFVHKPAATYNYLSPKSKSLLEQTARNHFKMELTKYINKIFFASKQKGSYKPSRELTVQAFMENNGIECTETNIEAIKKIWSRLYDLCYKSKSKNKTE